MDRDGASVALFRWRAGEVGASLDVDRDMDAIVRICRRLDGIPLAIELAAARARSLRPAEIADRLGDMFRLSTGGRRVSAERHRTLRATLAWSYDLLREPERAVLDRLSIFAGSFALDAVEAVVAGEPIVPDAIVDIIDRLVSRSLLVPLEEPDETRFRLLEPECRNGPQRCSPVAIRCTAHMQIRLALSVTAITANQPARCHAGGARRRAPHRAWARVRRAPARPRSPAASVSGSRRALSLTLARCRRHLTHSPG
jgi:hypothetical protein